MSRDYDWVEDGARGEAMRESYRLGRDRRGWNDPPGRVMPPPPPTPEPVTLLEPCMLGVEWCVVRTDHAAHQCRGVYAPVTAGALLHLDGPDDRPEP